jgi:hypothetical protein
MVTVERGASLVADNSITRERRTRRILIVLSRSTPLLMDATAWRIPFGTRFAVNSCPRAVDRIGRVQLWILK